MFERCVREWRGQDANQAAEFAWADAEVVDIPAERPGAEPGQPDPGDKASRADQSVADARAIALYRGVARFRGRMCNVHRVSMGLESTQARWFKPYCLIMGK